MVHSLLVPANGVTATTDLATAGARIRFLRQAKDMTQESLARKVFTSQPTVARWEKDEFVPSQRATRQLLADTLGCSREFLFGEQAA